MDIAISPRAPRRPGAPQVLLLIEMQAAFIGQLQQCCQLKVVSPAAPMGELPQDTLGGIEVVITNGSTGLSAAQMQRLPALALVCSYGAGYENIDLEAARAGGIAVTHAPGVNNATVADHAIALMLAIARGLPELDRAVKAGQWQSHRQARPTVNGRRLGLLGMGNIGELIARRAAAFDMHVSYFTRRPRPELPYAHVASLLELARDSDFLILACPGGTATRHLVDTAVLDLLGRQGFLINIARGSVVDTAALLQALRERRIAGAALDVIEDEPALPACVGELANLILTPHISGRSPEAQLAQQRLLIGNLEAYCKGKTLRNAL